MRSFTVNSEELTYVIYRFLNLKQETLVDEIFLEKFSRLLAEYRSGVLTGYAKNS